MAAVPAEVVWGLPQGPWEVCFSDSLLGQVSAGSWEVLF